MTADTTLAPCPFCGHVPLRKLGDSDNLVMLVCPPESACAASGLCTGYLLDDEAQAISAWNRRTQPPAPQGPSNAALADAIEAACRGRKEWQVMNADETALCMWFTHDDHTRPAQAAQKWLDEHPTREAEGYHVVERHLHSELETLALEAAKRLRSQAAPQGLAEFALRARGAVPSGAAQQLGARLATLLDEDQWAECEKLLLRIDSAPRALIAKWRHAAEHLGVDGLASLADCADELHAALAAAPSAPTQEAAPPAAGQGDAEALLQAIEQHRISLIPEYEGPWDASIYSDEPEPVAVGTGESPREAIKAALAAKGQAEGSAA